MEKIELLKIIEEVYSKDCRLDGVEWLDEDLANILLEKFEQELDKAREEQFTQKELKRIEELLGFMLSDYPSSFWKPEDKSIEKKLSKLKQ